jgi:prefoldin alpha subunit
MEKQESEREIYMRATFLQKSIEELESQLQIINRQIVELDEFMIAIKSFIVSQDKEMLASFGKGVFVKTDVKDKKLFVDAGAGVLVRKTPEETLLVVEEQIIKLGEVKVHLAEQFDSRVRELQALVVEVESHRHKQ